MVSVLKFHFNLVRFVLGQLWMTPDTPPPLPPGGGEGGGGGWHNVDDCSNASLKGQPDEIRRCEKLSKSFGLCLIINYKRILHISSNLLESRDFTV